MPNRSITDMHGDHDMRRPVEVVEFEKGRYFVGGLTWVSFPEKTGRELKSEIKRVAAEDGFVLLAERKSAIPQFGFAGDDSEAKSGYLSIAAIVAQKLEEEGYTRHFQCAIPINSHQWAYVSMVEGVIRFAGDFVGTESEARKVFLENINFPDWEILIAPTSWALRGTESRHFSDFLTKTKKGKIDYRKISRLRPVNGRFSGLSMSRRILLFLFLTTISYAGYEFWHVHMEKKEKERIALLDEIKRRPKVVPPAWKSQPRATVLAGACQDTLSTVKNLWPDGWKIKEITCIPGKLTISWQRPELGTVERFHEVLPDAEISEDGNLATKSIAFTAESGAEDELPDVVERRNQMNTLAQRHDLSLSFTSSQRKPLNGATDPRSNNESRNWQELNWQIANAPLQPQTIASTFEANGLRITKITTLMNGGLFTWNLEGIQYAKK